MGHSAGAHLVSLLCLDESHLINMRVPKSAVSSIRALICISGVYSQERLKKKLGGVKLYLEPVFGPVASKWSEAFPLKHVRAGAPPFLLLNAEFEMNLGLHSHSADFFDALKASGVRVVRQIVPCTNHISIVQRIGRKPFPHQRWNRASSMQRSFSEMIFPNSTVNRARC